MARNFPYLRSPEVLTPEQEIQFQELTRNYYTLAPPDTRTLRELQHMRGSRGERPNWWPQEVNVVPAPYRFIPVPPPRAHVRVFKVSDTDWAVQAKFGDLNVPV